MKKSISLTTILAVQVVTIGGFFAAWQFSTPQTRDHLQAALGHEVEPRPVEIKIVEPIRITPLYDDPSVVTDQQLAAVLSQIQPIFAAEQLKPNYVEHALRAWGVDAEFQNPAALSGVAMRDFLTDHGRYLASWGDSMTPLLQDEPAGVAIRWGREECASVHHDHLLACMTEAGVRLDHRVFTPSRSDMTMNDLVQQALYDFRLDERETEWSAMAFGFWLAPSGVKTWHLRDGRKMSFDILAHRLIRGQKQLGVCSGTHRVYSMAVLLRLDDEYEILSPAVRDEIWRQLQLVRDLITDAQFEDGRWPPNWPDGKQAAANLSPDEPAYRTVIATGHHLEWLAIAPQELHPPHEQIVKAAKWIIEESTSKPRRDVQKHYTFYSHVGNALALWRKTRPAVFWKEWEQQHPWTPESEPEEPAGESDEDSATDAH